MENIFFEEAREIVGTISKPGIELREHTSKAHGGLALATDYPANQRPEPFGPTTVIIEGGYGVWGLELPKEVRKRLIDINLRIDTIRAHGMLHTPWYNKSATIYVNDRRLDKIYLVKPHPHGLDFGVDTRRPLPILDFIDKGKPIQTIRIETEDEVFRDIDRVALEAIVLRKRLKQWVWIVIGALLSIVGGGIFTLLVATSFPGCGQ